MAGQILFNNIVADATSATFISSGGKFIVNVRGDDFTNVTVNIQVASPNDPNDPKRFATLENGSFQENRTRTMDFIPAGMLVRAISSGVGPGDNIFCEVIQ